MPPAVVSTHACVVDHADRVIDQLHKILAAPSRASTHASSSTSTTTSARLICVFVLSGAMDIEKFCGNLAPSCDALSPALAVRSLHMHALTNHDDLSAPVLVVMQLPTNDSIDNATHQDLAALMAAVRQPPKSSRLVAFFDESTDERVLVSNASFVDNNFVTKTLPAPARCEVDDTIHECAIFVMDNLTRVAIAYVPQRKRDALLRAISLQWVEYAAAPAAGDTCHTFAFVSLHNVGGDVHTDRAAFWKEFGASFCAVVRSRSTDHFLVLPAHVGALMACLVRGGAWDAYLEWLAAQSSNVSVLGLPVRQVDVEAVRSLRLLRTDSIESFGCAAAFAAAVGEAGWSERTNWIGSTDSDMHRLFADVAAVTFSLAQVEDDESVTRGASDDPARMTLDDIVAHSHVTESHGDGDFAVAIASTIAQPGACYLVFRANQLHAVLERPRGDEPFHIADVGRLQRWMSYITHLAAGQRIGETHIPVAMHGFVDWFVIVMCDLCRTSDTGAIDVDSLCYDLMSGEVVVCSGRSDGWRELRRANEVDSLALPMDPSLFAVVSMRVHDPAAESMMLATGEIHQVDVNEERNGATIAFAPTAPVVDGDFMLIEMLVMVEQWQLVRPRASANGGEAEAALVAEVVAAGEAAVSEAVAMAEEESVRQALAAATARATAAEAAQVAAEAAAKAETTARLAAEANEKAAVEREKATKAALEAELNAAEARQRDAAAEIERERAARRAAEAEAARARQTAEEAETSTRKAREAADAQARSAAEANARADAARSSAEADAKSRAEADARADAARAAAEEQARSAAEANARAEGARAAAEAYARSKVEADARANAARAVADAHARSAAEANARADAANRERLRVAATLDAERNAATAAAQQRARDAAAAPLTRHEVAAILAIPVLTDPKALTVRNTRISCGRLGITHAELVGLVERNNRCTLTPADFNRLRFLRLKLAHTEFVKRATTRVAPRRKETPVYPYFANNRDDLAASLPGVPGRGTVQFPTNVAQALRLPMTHVLIVARLRLRTKRMK
jgi:hypothetical protein